MIKFLLKYFYCFALTAIIILSPLISKSQTNDFQTWAAFNIEKEWAKKYTLGLTEELRLTDNSCEIGKINSELKFDYQITRKLNAGIAYRFSLNRQLENYFENRNRANIDLSWKEKVNYSTFTLRLRYQNNFGKFNDFDDPDSWKNTLRAKLKYKYKATKSISIFADSEIYLSINDDFLPNNLRYSAGIEYKFNKKISTDLFYMFEHEINVANREKNYIVGLELNYKL